MKKFFLMAAAMFVLMGSVTVLTSCGDDEDEKAEKAAADIASGKVKPNVNITESDNQLVLTVVYPGVYTETDVATFDAQGKCIKYISTETYATDKLADAAWQAIQQEYSGYELEAFTRNGKTIVEDETNYYAGDTKEEVKAWFEALKKELEQGNLQ